MSGESSATPKIKITVAQDYPMTNLTGGHGINGLSRSAPGN